MNFITLKNIMIWDGELSPSIVDQITIDPTKYSALSEDEKWIIVGKWKIKVDVEPSGSGFLLSGSTGVSPLKMSSSGQMFVDESFFTISTLSTSIQPMGSARGCFEINW
ncbi:hypothetical protein CBX98_23790 [Vibrio sp. T9]|uniref:hypothetical protein n=1 Tax=Vibrio sp. T9 TaxID=2007196 RepID=UPI000D64FBE0|nr:hypothetical protein [Vibrio sp. T9]PWF67648.1 hypothetical protein CBX98_23790 [Vibrio sp. T9]